jgi:hypothetical protein
VTIIEIVCRALVGIQTLASSIASIKTSFAGAKLLDTHGVGKRSRTVYIGCTGIIVLVLVVIVLALVLVRAVGESFWLCRWQCTSRDAISLEAIIASANEAVLGCWRRGAGCVDMAC